MELIIYMCPPLAQIFPQWFDQLFEDKEMCLVKPLRNRARKGDKSGRERLEMCRKREMCREGKRECRSCGFFNVCFKRFGVLSDVHAAFISAPHRKYQTSPGSLWVCVVRHMWCPPGRFETRLFACVRLQFISYQSPTAVFRHAWLLASVCSDSPALRVSDMFGSFGAFVECLIIGLHIVFRHV